MHTFLSEFIANQSTITMPTNLSLSRSPARTVAARPFHSLLGSSKFMRRLPGAASPSASSGMVPLRLWDPGLLDRLRMPLSRIHE